MLSVPEVAVSLQRLYYKQNSVVFYLPVRTIQDNLSKNNYIYVYMYAYVCVYIYLKSEIFSQVVILKTSEKHCCF